MNPSTCICEIGKYLGSIIDDSVITGDEITNVRDSISNVTSSVSTNFYNKKVRYELYYIMHIVLLVIILLFIIAIAIVCYHYEKHRCKQVIVLPY